MSASTQPARRPFRLPALDAPVTIAVLLGAFAAVAALVVAGAFSSLDQYAVDHAMPALRPPYGGSGIGYAGLVRPFSSQTPWWDAVLATWTYPCSVLVSGLAVTVVALVLWRRGRDFAALTVAAAWVVANAVELAGKSLLRRPLLYGPDGGHRAVIAPFDNSFPSGHMLRGTLVVGAVWLVAPRLGRILVVWAALDAVFLVVTAAHTPSDVLGGLLFGLALVGTTTALASHPALNGSGTSSSGRLFPGRSARRASAR